MGNQIYKQISKFAEMQRDEIKREKAKKKRKSVCIDPDSVIKDICSLRCTKIKRSQKRFL